ncbi:MAG: hypothetical protein ABL986_18205 [Vicinamibacterales bacterium]
MTQPYQSADLILKLYDLRREAKMREARQWFIGFTPDSLEELLETMKGPHNADFRMVATYWDMAASLVLNGAIDEQMFVDANAEHVAVFAKIEPFLAGYREKAGVPHYLKNLEQLVMRLPNAKERLAATRERLRALALARAQAART